ncbi:hypothetical protein PIB30_077228 [Stylosanthes scabra]|uniref:Uncharacterized protein n=1 Tax=Stylosanthes scabra TaxID=79078 RepID=A0ABU6WT98_9FABA|nr:hypothetical protein [Stylosanthes scabra]
MDSVSGGGSFLVLFHHHGKIKRRTREGVKFKSECPSNVFITVVSSGVKYDCFSVDTDEDLQPPPVHVQPTYAPLPVRAPKTERVASSTFDVNLPQDDDDACDLGDNCSFGKLVVTMAGTPQSPSQQICHASPDLLVEEALRCNDSDEELALIEGDSNDEGGTIPVEREGPSSFGTQQYPPHFSTLNLEPGSGVGPVDGDFSTGVHGWHGANVTAEFLTTWDSTAPARLMHEHHYR